MEPDLGTLHRRLQQLEARQARDGALLRAGVVWVSVLAFAGTLLSGQSPDSLFVDAQGRVGIGTTTPSQPLTIRHSGNGTIITDRSQSSLWSGLTLDDNGVANERWFVGMPGGNNNLVWRNRAANNVVTIEDNAKGNQLYLDSSGRIGVGTMTPVASLDIVGAPRTDTHPGSVQGLYVTGNFGPNNNGVEFRHTNGTQGIGFGYNTIYATGTNASQDLNLSARGGGSTNITAASTNISGPLNVYNVITTNGRYQRDNNGEGLLNLATRYHLSLTSAFAGWTRAIPNDTLASLCGDADGCEMRLAMTGWGSAADSAAASTSFLFYYSGTGDGRWRVEERAGAVSGIDGQSGVQHIANLYNTCFVTDGTYSNYNGADNDIGINLLVWNGYGAASRTCELTIID